MGLTKVTYAMIEGSALNVIDYGADNTGTDDSLAAIQAAVNAAADNQAIYLPAGTYKVTGSIDLTGNEGVHLIGAGQRATEIVSTADAPVIKIAGSSSSITNSTGVRDMTIRGSGKTNTSAHGVSFAWTNSCYLHNLVFYSCRHAMHFEHNWQTDVNNIRVYGTGSDQSYIGVYMAETDLTYIDNAIVGYNINIQNTSGYGFRIINGQGSKFTACEAGGNPMINAWYIGDPTTGTVLSQWIHFTGCLGDSTTDSTWLFRKGSATELSEMQLANCWGGNGIHGFYMEGVHNTVATNLLALGHARTGVTLYQCEKVTISNSHFLKNNEDANTSYGDINIQAGDYNMIQGNICETNNVAGQKSLIESSATNSNTIANNSLYQGATIVGADSYVYKNAGFRSETRGSATITAAATSVTVTHNLGITPPLDSITVTPTSNIASSSKFWIENATSTTFDILVNTAPGASIGFAYSINNVRLGY